MNPNQNTDVHQRLKSVDTLRGIVIVLMALDHTRDFFSASQFDPRNVYEPALFLTRWITHICAPVFIFLSGISIYFWQLKHSLNETRSFVIKRGILLIILEFTVVKFGWMFNMGPDLFLAQVIWVIGWCMIVLALLTYLPINYILIISITTILGHNLLDPITATHWGSLGFIWNFLHEPDLIKIGGSSGKFVG